jgi:hypothetical protein
MFVGCFFFVGAALPGDLRPHHKSVFDFDEVRSSHCVEVLRTVCTVIVYFLLHVLIYYELYSICPCN